MTMIRREIGCSVPLGFAALMLGMFLWTLDHHVVWIVLGFVAIIVCWWRSNATDDDEK